MPYTHFHFGPKDRYTNLASPKIVTTVRPTDPRIRAKLKSFSNAQEDCPFVEDNLSFNPPVTSSPMLLMEKSLTPIPKRESSSPHQPQKPQTQPSASPRSPESGENLPANRFQLWEQGVSGPNSSPGHSPSSPPRHSSFRARGPEFLSPEKLSPIIHGSSSILSSFPSAVLFRTNLIPNTDTSISGVLRSLSTARGRVSMNEIEDERCSSRTLQTCTPRCELDTCFVLTTFHANVVRRQ